MKKISRRSFLAASAALAAASLTTGCGGASAGKTHLPLQTWAVFQRDGMQALCAAYTAMHPEVTIEVQVTSWNEYWTKLEAATMARQAPDIFWMHTNEILKYAGQRQAGGLLRHRRDRQVQRDLAGQRQRLGRQTVRRAQRQGHRRSCVQ